MQLPSSGGSDEPVTAVSDGRRARRERSRTAAIDALLGLLARGALAPSAKDIAAAAGIAERTLFNLFPDKEAVLAAALARFRERALAEMPHAPRRGTVPARVEQFVKALAPFLDEYSTIRWAALTDADAPADMRRGVVQSALLTRFQEIVDDAGLVLDVEGTAALRVCVDPLTWRQLRVQQRLSRERAGAVLARMVVVLMQGFCR